MTPTPAMADMEQPKPEVLITGMSGRFPKSNSIKAFQDNLYNRVDMMEAPTDRWEFSHPEMPPRLGICPDMETFDAQFFAIHYKQSTSMDPTIRKLLECACEAVIDAGINPKSLRNGNTGVFMAASISESEKNLNYDSSTISGYGLTGSSRSHMANRVSFWLGTHGPSYSSDNACCGGALALQQAYHAMTQGYCDTALVGSSNLCLEPCVNLHFRWMDLLTLGENTKSFNKTSDGYLRSDGIVVFFLQKPKDAKRVYAQLLHTKTIYTGIREIDHTFQLLNPDSFGKFLHEFYEETDVKPEEVEYVEACGTGVNNADYEELEKINEVFCKNRKGPVKVGSVKSNMGNSEASSPLAALVKVCLAYHTGEIAGNLHLDNPRTDVAGVKEGRIQLLGDNEAFNRGYAAINTYSYNGVTGHILLKNYDIGKRQSTKRADIPYLICVSSRNEDTLKCTFEDLESKPLDPRQMALVNNVYGNEVVGFLMRGYKIYSNDPIDPEILAEGSEYHDGRQRPVWFVYSGMGSQWPTMGAQLMRFPVFAAAIERCRCILEEKGLDLLKLLTDPDPDTFSNILHSFVAIAAVQIGLTDLLYSLGITPDNIIGHSVGELGCAYADGCLSTEEMILSAYYRGLVSVETPLIKGSMAAIGLGYKTIRSVCPPDIEVACHNGHDSSTVSGPAEIMKAFVGELTKRGVFAKEVACSNIAYHSRYIAAAGPGLEKYMSQIIKNPKQRSPRWISSSVPQLRWDEAAAKFCSAKYLTNNLLNPVLFEESSRLIPDNAITIEIAPHGLLQAILNRSLPSNCINVSLTRRGHKDNVLYLLNAVGRLYIAGLYPKLEEIYPNVQFPVAADTPLLSHTLAWMHDEVWPVGCGRRPAPENTGKYHYVLSTKDCDHAYLTGHFINGANIYPAAAQLVLIWETLGMVQGVPYTELAVHFENIRFNAEVIIPKDEPLELTVYLQQSGNFEITKHGIAVASGQIKPCKSFVENTLEPLEADEMLLEAKDVYRMLAVRGYDYNGDFRSIKSVNGIFNSATIDFKNWVTFLDGLMQFSILDKNNTGVSRPRRIQALDIDIHKFNGIQELEAVKFKRHGVTRCAGVMLKEFVTEDFNVTHLNNTKIQKYEFIPFITETVEDLDAIKLHLQTILENNENKIHIIDITDNKSLKEIVKTSIDGLRSHEIEIDYKIIPEQEIETCDVLYSADLIISCGLKKLAEKINLSNIKESTIILNIEKGKVEINGLTIVSQIVTSNNCLSLLRKPIQNALNVIAVDGNVNLENILQNTTNTVVFVSRNQGNELIEKLQKIKKDSSVKLKMQVLIITDDDAPNFDHKVSVYEEQIKKGLVVNIYKNGVWGNYRYVDLTEAVDGADNTKLDIVRPGDLDSLTWVSATPPKESNRILVKVHYIRISCSDLINVRKCKEMAYDAILDRTFGVSYSGVTKSGERVMGLLKNNTISSIVEADPELLWPVPEYWTLKEAATVPRAYVQALYYLYYKSNSLPQNMSVLVTNGSGALGQAIISTCLASGCKVFTTVGDRRKKLLLLKMFPQINENNICASEDTALLQMISEGTNGQGCDLIISSVNGGKRLDTMNCLAPFSHFIDIGVSDMADNADFGMFFLSAGRAYLASNFASVFGPDESPLRKTLRKTIYDGILEGWIRPLSHVVFDSQQAPKAFRFLAGRRNHGAVLLKIRSSSASTFEVMPTWKCEGHVAHVVVCGDNAQGVEVADRLVTLGARRLVIQAADVDGYLKFNIKKWTPNNVSTSVSSDDLSSSESVSSLLTTASDMGPLASIFFIKTTNKDDKIMKSLDEVSRTYVNLRKFVVITIDDKRGVLDQVTHDVFEDRMKNGLPITVIRDSTQKMQMETNTPISITLDRTAKYLNQVLARKPGIYRVGADDGKEKTVSDILAEALNLQSIDELDVDLTVRELDIQQCYLNELCDVLVGICQKTSDVEEILSMTLKEVHELDNRQKGGKENTTSVFSLFFRHYENENLFVTEPLIWMPTVISDGDNRVDFYKGEDYLIVVPGMDGHRTLMYRLCRRLRLRAILCQYPVEVKSETVQELAAHFAQKIKSKIGIGSKFYILGYSFGALVALEMAAIFENNGMKGKVFCLDGSPKSLQTILQEYTSNVSEEVTQNQLLNHMYKLMSKSQETISNELEHFKEWDEKIDYCLKKLKYNIEEPFEYQKLIIESAYSKLKQAVNYETEIQLNSEIVLLKASNSIGDYGLDELSRKPVTVYNLAADHLAAPYDLTCSDIINQELSLDKSKVKEAIARLYKLNSSIDGRMIR